MMTPAVNVDLKAGGFAGSLRSNKLRPERCRNGI
jgi:hypothetical protein